MILIAFIKNWIGNIRADNAEYVDLAPTDKADPSGIYSKALTEATSNPNVSNIALTGPYGSGKSSIIKAFLKSYERFPFFKRRVLQISLAAFLPEADLASEEVSKQEIERSILQQMLYGADANKLPLSRFKRIQSPKKWAPLVSLFIIVGLAAFWHVIQNRTEILDGSFFQPLDQTNWFDLASFTIALAFAWQTIHQIYIKSYGVSLKSISLKDIQITPDKAEEESILNRHLDEIIYFFQSTKYDLVIIEDLDRFNNPDVFVTLREINSLINANAGVRRQIRFLYALRDNMFVNTDRTKFFEFIVPVIPIINSSNSIDKVIEQSERLSLDGRLDRQYLREVSRYLNDLRLIQNIFNEYSIYVKNLVTDEENVLDPNKLLAVLIYKNVLPSDFEALHQEKGKLADILNRHETLIVSAEAGYKAKITELEQQISDAEKQVPSDLNELRRIYAMALVGKMPLNYSQIEIGGVRIPIQSLSDHQNFDEVFELESITTWAMQNQRRNINISGFQTEINAKKTYQQRKEEIEHKSVESKNAANKSINELREKVSRVRFAKFNEIIRMDLKGTEALFDAFAENCELIRFLVFEGYLDDTYYQYTSLFHSGRLSPNDNKFLIQIRAFINPEPDFQIDNPKEVIAAMRDDDFHQSYVLNSILVDCILSASVEYYAQQMKLLSFVSSNFKLCASFFSTYYRSGDHISQLLSRLIIKWPGFTEAALSSPDAITHAARFLAHLPEPNLKTLNDTKPAFIEFLSANLTKILSLEIDFDPDRLKNFQLDIEDLESIKPYPAILQLLTNEGKFKVSISNVKFIYHDVLSLPNSCHLETRHYSTLLTCGNDVLLDRIEENFGAYLNDILLKLESNTEEDVPAIIKILNHEELELELLEEFLGNQTVKLPSLEEVPSHLYSSVFRLNKIAASWDNCLTYVVSENFDVGTLTSFLEQDVYQVKLSTVIIDSSDDAKPLRQFIFNSIDMGDNSYRTYIRTLPKTFNQFPENADPKKLLILVEEQRISFSKVSFDHLEENLDLQVLFISNNIDAYFKQKGEFSLDDDFREKLLNLDISDEDKLKIVEDMELSLIVDLPNRASVIGELIHRTESNIIHFPPEVVQAIIMNLKPVQAQVSILNLGQKMFSNEQIELVLQEMPDPFPDIKPGYKQPKIPDSEANRELVEWLEKRKIISSWKESIFGGINIYNRRT